MSQIQSHNAVVFAISADTIESHRRFADQYHLGFPLLADPGKTTIEAYGALAPSGVANRYTFIVGPDGKVLGIDRAVNSQFGRDNGQLVSWHGKSLALLLSSWQARIGGPVPNFSVPTPDGQAATPLQPGKKAAVVVFVSTTCPVSHAYEGRLRDLAARYPDVSFLAVDSNADESAAQLRALAERARFRFPVANDASGAIARHFGALSTPTAWVVDARGTAVYRGAIDDNQDAARAGRHYLEDALDAVLQGKPVPTAQTSAFGCRIRPKR